MVDLATIDLGRRALKVDRRRAPAPAALVSMLADTDHPVFLMDWEAAALIGANEATERHLGLSLRELTGLSGRQLMAPACAAPLAKWVTQQLVEVGEYHGAVAMRRGTQTGPAVGVSIVVVEHGGYRYSINVLRPFEPAANEARPTLLYLEDNLEIQRAMTRVLCTRYDVRAAHDGYEALRWLNVEHGVGAVLTDLDMPLIDGPQFIDVVRTIRPDLAGRIVILSGGYDRRCPADIPFLAKPAPITDVFDALDRALA